MGARAAVLLVLLAAGCERDRQLEPEPERRRESAPPADPDCDVVHKDPRNAAATLSQKYRNAPLKVAEIIERCVAPSGATCDRLARIVAAIPGLMPAGSPAVTAPTRVAELCAGMPPEMQRCMLPSYTLAHEAECAKVREAIMAGAARQIEITP
jgi:hypothetical protein